MGKVVYSAKQPVSCSGVMKQCLSSFSHGSPRRSVARANRVIDRIDARIHERETLGGIALVEFGALFITRLAGICLGAHDGVAVEIDARSMPAP